MPGVTQEVWTCNPRGLIPSRGFFRHTSWSAFHTSCRCRLGYIPLGLHVIPLGLHDIPLGYTSWVTCHTSWNTWHTSWVTHLGPYLLGYTIPLGMHWDVHPKRYECNPRGIPKRYAKFIPLGYTSWVAWGFTDVFIPLGWADTRTQVGCLGCRVSLRPICN